jgi:hypothetical protein
VGEAVGSCDFWGCGWAHMAKKNQKLCFLSYHFKS